MQREIRVRTATVEDRLPAELHPVVRRVYLNRGVGSAKDLDLSLRHLLPFTDLKGIDAAVDLLLEAIEQDGHILIIGDFDADGATSTALSMEALSRLGAKRVSYLVPDRFQFGYGLTPEIVAVAQSRQPDLIMTVDNGMSSIKGVDVARAAGIKVLITDHHLPGRDLPAADAIVNPNQAGCRFSSKKLAGVGVVFYVMAALRARLRAVGRMPDTDWSPAELLDLVALGTVSDLVPLDYNNRILVHQGIQRIRAGYCKPGIQALLQVAGRNPAQINAADLGFYAGPRLNAAGRLQDMSLGIDCLLASDHVTAKAMAARLDAINQERRDLQAQMQESAMDAVEELLTSQEELPVGLCIYDESWHEGIVGLVASKLKERFHRPAIAFAPSGQQGLLKGSARSIAGLHIRDALDRVASLYPGLIEKFGGHAMAAGLSLRMDQLEAFKGAFNSVVEGLLDADSLNAVLESEGGMAAMDMSLQTAQYLAAAGPWGQAFPEPVFHDHFELLALSVLKERHFKMQLLPQDAEQPVEAIAFNALTSDQEVPRPGDRLQMAYRLAVNEYRGYQSAQLIIEAIFRQ